MLVPEDLKYAETHEWVRIDKTIGTVGITDHAQAELTDIVYVELPQVGAKVTAKKQAAVVESVKAASDIYSPVSGEVTEINGDLESNPALVNTGPYTEGCRAQKLCDWKKRADLIPEIKRLPHFAYSAMPKIELADKSQNDKLQITDDRLSRSELVRPARTSLRTANTKAFVSPVILSICHILIILWFLAELVGEQGRLSRDPTADPGDCVVEPLCLHPVSIPTRVRQFSHRFNAALVATGRGLAGLVSYIFILRQYCLGGGYHSPAESVFFLL